MIESTTSPCLLCSGDTEEDGEQTYRHPTDWVRCTTCGFSQVEPMPTAGELIELYASGDYRNFTGVCVDGEWLPYHEHDENGTLWGLQRERQERHRIVQWCLEDGPLIDSRGKTYLDVGASTGQSVEFMKERGLEAYGVEPGNWGREWGAYEFLEDAPLDKYDIVTCLHVLEHVPDPVAFLRQLIDKTAIQLCLEVPIGHKRIWPHVGDFTQDSFRQMVIREGCKPVIDVRGIYLLCAIDVSS